MPGAMEYTKHDEDLAKEVVFSFEGGQRVEFQFPPVVPSDGRRGNWREGELRGVEPLAVFATSGPRIITLSWTYIVDGGIWTSKKISQNVRMVRGYFARVRSPNNTRALVVTFKMWRIGGPKEITARIVDVAVKQSQTVVGSGEDAYPLRTDVSVDLRLWTTLGGEALQQIQGLKPEDPDWY